MLRRAAIALLLASIRLGQDSVSRMEQVVRSYVDAKQFMGSVLVARDGKVLFSKGYGSANLEWDIPDSPSTNFVWVRSPSSLRQLASCYWKSVGS